VGGENIKKSFFCFFLKKINKNKTLETYPFACFLFSGYLLLLLLFPFLFERGGGGGSERKNEKLTKQQDQRLRNMCFFWGVEEVL